MFQGLTKTQFLATSHTLFCNFVFFPHSGKSVKQGWLFGETNEERKFMLMLFWLTSSSISCPSCVQVHHFTQGHDGISASFWGPNWLIASQHRPLQFPTYCKMLAKCCINRFCCHQCQTVVGFGFFFLSFFYWHRVASTLYIRASMSGIPGQQTHGDVMAEQRWERGDVYIHDC